MKKDCNDVKYVDSNLIGFNKEVIHDGGVPKVHLVPIIQDFETMQPLAASGVTKIPGLDEKLDIASIFTTPKFFDPEALGMHEDSFVDPDCSNLMNVGFVHYIRDKNYSDKNAKTAIGFMKRIGVNALRPLIPDITYSVTSSNYHSIRVSECFECLEFWKRSVITIRHAYEYKTLFEIIITRHSIADQKECTEEFVLEYFNRDGALDQVTLAFKDATPEGTRRLVYKYLQYGINAYLEELCRASSVWSKDPKQKRIVFPTNKLYNSVLNQELSPSDI